MLFLWSKTLRQYSTTANVASESFWLFIESLIVFVNITAFWKMASWIISYGFCSHLTPKH